MALWKENTAPARPTPLTPFPEAKEPARYDAPPQPEAVNSPAAAPPAPATRPPPFPEAKERARADAPPKPEAVNSPAAAPQAPVTRAAPAAPRKESLIAADITIEGKIEGGGSARISGTFMV